MKAYLKERWFDLLASVVFTGAFFALCFWLACIADSRRALQAAEPRAYSERAYASVEYRVDIVTVEGIKFAVVTREDSVAICQVK